MIKVNDRFSFERDKYQWVLHEKRLGKDKHGNDKIHVDISFHGNLYQTAEAIINSEAGECESIEELTRLLIRTQSYCESYLNKMVENKINLVID